MWDHHKRKYKQTYVADLEKVTWFKSEILLYFLLRTSLNNCNGYDFRIWGQRFFPFFQHGSMPKRLGILPLYSGADEAFSRNSNTNTFTQQHQIPRLRQIQPHWCLWALRFSPFFLTRQHADTIQEHHATVL